MRKLSVKEERRKNRIARTERDGARKEGIGKVEREMQEEI
jgi:hypothetical protein